MAREPPDIPEVPVLLDTQADRVVAIRATMEEMLLPLGRQTLAPGPIRTFRMPFELATRQF